MPPEGERKVNESAARGTDLRRRDLGGEAPGQFGCPTGLVGRHPTCTCAPRRRRRLFICGWDVSSN